MAGRDTPSLNGVFLATRTCAGGVLLRASWTKWR